MHDFPTLIFNLVIKIQTRSNFLKLNLGLFAIETERYWEMEGNPGDYAPNRTSFR